MAKKVVSVSGVFVVLLLAIIVFFMVTARASSDTAAELWQAGQYAETGSYEQAETIYRAIIADYPGTGDAFTAQEKLACLYVLWGRLTDANSAYDTLLAEYSGFDGIAVAVDHVADEYRGIEAYDKARDCYEYAVDNWPQAEHAVESAMSSVLCNILESIELGDDTAVEQDVNGLIADFYDHRSLPRVIFQAGEGYYNKALEYANEGHKAEAKGRFTKAAGVWEMMLAELTPDANTPRAYYFAAGCYKRVGEYQDSIAYYQTVVDDWNDYEYAWNALAMVGLNYEKLKSSGAVSKSQADQKIKAAYGQLLEEYPDCKAARHARRWLNRHNSR